MNKTDKREETVEEVDERIERTKYVIKNGDDKRVELLADFFKNNSTIYTLDLLLFMRISLYISEGFMVSIDKEEEILDRLMSEDKKTKETNSKMISLLEKASLFLEDFNREFEDIKNDYKKNKVN